VVSEVTFVKPSGNWVLARMIGLMFDLKEGREEFSDLAGLRARLALLPSRKMRPTRMLRQPTEKRKKADTRANSSIWCERTEAPIKHWKTPRAPTPKSGPRTGK